MNATEFANAVVMQAARLPSCRQILARSLAAVAIVVLLPHLQPPAKTQAQSSRGALPGQTVALVTGSTSGLGRELAIRLGARGDHVIVHGRDEERGAEVVDAINAAGPGSARFYGADFASLAGVRAFAERLLADYDRLDILINNAGFGSAPNERWVTEDGHEYRFQVNYLSTFLLTHMLMPRLLASAPARIVNVSSGAQTQIDFDDVMIENNFSGRRAYAQSKLAQILFTHDLAEDLAGTGIVVGSLHPATYMPTEMVRRAGATPRSTIAEGADAVMQVVDSDDFESGQYFSGLRATRANDQAYDRDARARLRRLSAELTGLRCENGRCALTDSGVGRSGREPAAEERERRQRREAMRTAARPIAGINSVWIDELTWMEVRDEIAAGKTTGIVATGGVEQNGPYMAGGKHNYVLEAMCDAIARELGDALCAPVMKYVPEGDPENIRYPGTLSVRQETFRMMLEDVANSLKSQGFADVVFIGDSGGNQSGMAETADKLNARWEGAARAHYVEEYYREDIWSCDFLKEKLGIFQQPDLCTATRDLYHDDVHYSAIVATTDPERIRARQRIEAGLYSINGVELGPVERTREIGRALIAYRTEITVRAIRASQGGSSAR